MSPAATVLIVVQAVLFAFLFVVHVSHLILYRKMRRAIFVTLNWIIARLPEGTNIPPVNGSPTPRASVKFYGKDRKPPMEEMDKEWEQELEEDFEHVMDENAVVSLDDEQLAMLERIRSGSNPNMTNEEFFEAIEKLETQRGRG